MGIFDSVAGLGGALLGNGLADSIRSGQSRFRQEYAAQYAAQQKAILQQELAALQLNSRRDAERLARGEGKVRDHQQMLRYNDFPVYWCGFESTTHRLSQSGWKVAVHHEPAYLAYRFFFHHKDIDLCAMSEESRFHDMVNGGIPIQVSHVAPKIQVMNVPTVASGLGPDWREVDCSIQPREIEEIRPDNIFLYGNSDEELLVDSANMEVIDHLAAIKDLQSEKQREIRDKMRKKYKGTVVAPGESVTERKVLANVVELKVA